MKDLIRKTMDFKFIASGTIDLGWDLNRLFQQQAGERLERGNIEHRKFKGKVAMIQKRLTTPFFSSFLSKPFLFCHLCCSHSALKR